MAKIHDIYDNTYARDYNQRFLLNDLSKIDAEFERETIAQLLDEIGDNPRWLDVACGTGYFLSCFREIERSGLDLSPGMLEVARQANPNIPLIQGDYRDKRPQWEGKWDLVSCMWWAYCYVESLAEFEKVVENFASWTSDRGICFVPIFHPGELGSGDINLPYITKDLGEGGGFYQIEGFIWSWIEDDRTKQHLNLIAPQPEYITSVFKKYFERVEIVKYPQHDRQRMALVARQKKSQHRRSTPEKTGVKFANLVRFQEWWLYKIAPLLSIACAETLLLQLPPTTATLTTLTALLSVASVAAYGYLLNDICDIESDRLANKPNTAASLEPWQRFLLCLLFIGTGFAVPLLTHLGTLPIALLCANYLVPTLYSSPPLRLKERGIWGILSDATGAHLIPTLFFATAFLSRVPDPPRNALIFTGLAAAHAFFVGLRGIFLHQLWDRDNDAASHTNTFVSQRDPETVRQWINRVVFPLEIALLGSVAVLLSRSALALIPVFAVYFLFTLIRLWVGRENLDPSPGVGRNIVPHDLYEVWLPLTLATLLASRDLHYLGFAILTLVLFFPAVKNRTIELVGILKAAISQADLSPSAIAPNTHSKAVGETEIPVTNVTPLTPQMRHQLETEGYVVLENFLTPEELEDLQEFTRANPRPEDMKGNNRASTATTVNLPFRKKVSDKFKAIVSPKLDTIIPGYRTLFCQWFWAKPACNGDGYGLHSGPYVTDESRYASLGIWCPLNDVNPNGGCLCVIKGSHKLHPERSYYYRALNINQFYDVYDEKALSYIKENGCLTPIPLKAGQAILFDKRTIHCATPNISSIERVTATCFILIPQDAPHYLCHAEMEEAGLTAKIYEVDDEFYDRYIFPENPSSYNAKLIKADSNPCPPTSPKLLVEKVKALYPELAISRLDRPSKSTISITSLSPLTQTMRHQLESEGYVVLDNFLTPEELEDLQEFSRAHPSPKDMKNHSKANTVATIDLPFRKKVGDKFKAIAAPKLDVIIPGYRVLFCPWLWKKPNCDDNAWGLHHDPYFTDESRYLSLGIWCPLNDVDPEGGCLFFVKGSHKLTSEKSYSYRAFTFNQFYDEDTLSYIKSHNHLTSVPLKAGQAILFDKRVLHCSTPNTSNIERVSATCFIVIPKDAPLYLCYRKAGEATTEIYEVDDKFYDRYIWPEDPSGYEVKKLIKTDPFPCDPLPVERLVKQLDLLYPVHRDRAIVPETPTPQQKQEVETQTQLGKIDTELDAKPVEWEQQDARDRQARLAAIIQKRFSRRTKS